MAKNCLHLKVIFVKENWKICQSSSLYSQKYAKWPVHFQLMDKHFQVSKEKLAGTLLKPELT